HQLVERRLEERDIAVAADAVTPRPPHAGQEGDHGRIAAREVDEREAALRRWAVRVAGERLPTREPLHHVVVATLRRSWTGHAETGERAADDRRLYVLQLLVREPELRRLVAAKVGVDGVARTDEILEDSARVGVAQVEGDALLAPIEGLEEERVLALLEGR